MTSSENSDSLSVRFLYGFMRDRTPLRCVQAFTIAAFQKNTIVFPPCKIDIFKERNVRTSMFRTLFLRGDIPANRSYAKKALTLKGDQGKKKENFLRWKVPPEQLDYSHYLPIFYDGLSDIGYPYAFIARYGIHDMINVAPKKILPVIPQIILPIKKALNTRNPEIISATLRIIQHMCTCDPCIAVALVPFFRQLMPTFNLFLLRNFNGRNQIDYDRVGRVGDVIEETLMLLEKCGGRDAFINIKYSVPTYESCIY